MQNRYYQSGQICCLLLSGVVCLLMWSSSGCSSENLPRALSQPESVAPSEKLVLTIGVTEVQQTGSAYETVTFTGIVRPERFTNLSFARADRLQTIEVQEGEAVEADELLASLDQKAIELKQAGLEESMQQARQELAKLNPSGVIPTAEETRQKLQQLNRELIDINDELSKSGNSADLQTRVKALERQLELLNKNRRQQKIDELQERIAGYESQLKQVEQELQSGLLYAPYPGVIFQISASQGTLVSPAVTVLQLASHSQIVQVNVPNSVASRLTDTMTVVLQTDSDSFQGSVRAVLPQLDRNTRTRTVLVDVSPKSLGRELVSGETVNVQFEIDDPQTGFWLPLSALGPEHDGRWTIYVAQEQEEGHLVAARIVEIARLEQDRVLVKGDLAQGERVVRDGVQRVVPGQTVKIADEPTESISKRTGETSE